MKYFLTLFISLAAFAEPTPTDNYLALTAVLLEHRIIGDEHLLRMIDGQLNPISDVETKTDSQKLIAHTAYTNVLKNNIDASRVAPWAQQRLSREAKEREDKKEKQEKTKAIKLQKMNTVISSGPFHICAILENKKTKCWGDNYSGQLDSPAETELFSLRCSNSACHGISKSGQLTCWGYNKENCNKIDSPIKYLMPGDMLCFIDAKDRLFCNGKSTLEYGAADQQTYSSPLANQFLPDSPPKALHIVSGFDERFLCIHSKEDLGAHCFGDDAHNPGSPNLGPLYQIAASEFNVWALNLDGKIFSWDSKNKQPKLKLLPLPALMIDAFSNDVCAILADQSIHCWNHQGYDYTLPPEANRSFKTISVGYGFVCGISTDNEAICFKISNINSNEIDPTPPENIGRILSPVYFPADLEPVIPPLGWIEWFKAKFKSIYQ